MDVICLEDLDAFGAEMDDPIAELEQDLYHGLLETRGSNLDDPNRGLGLEDALSGPLDPQLLAEAIEAHCTRDDRVDSVTVSMTQLSPGGGNAGDSYAIQINIQPEGSIALTMSPFRIVRRIT